LRRVGYPSNDDFFHTFEFKKIKCNVFKVL
jgi:hypothetical protein